MLVKNDYLTKNKMGGGISYNCLCFYCYKNLNQLNIGKQYDIRGLKIGEKICMCDKCADAAGYLSWNSIYDININVDDSYNCINIK